MIKTALLWKKVCYKVSLCENLHRQICKAFTGLSIRVKIMGVGRPLKGKFCTKWTTLGAAVVLISVFTKSDEYPISIAMITTLYEIYNNAH